MTYDHILVSCRAFQCASICTTRVAGSCWLQEIACASRWGRSVRALSLVLLQSHGCIVFQAYNPEIDHIVDLNQRLFALCNFKPSLPLVPFFCDLDPAVACVLRSTCNIYLSLMPMLPIELVTNVMNRLLLGSCRRRWYLPPVQSTEEGTEIFFSALQQLLLSWRDDSRHSPRCAIRCLDELCGRRIVSWLAEYCSGAETEGCKTAVENEMLRRWNGFGVFEKDEVVRCVYPTAGGEQKLSCSQRQRATDLLRGAVEFAPVTKLLQSDLQTRSRYLHLFTQRSRDPCSALF